MKKIVFLLLLLFTIVAVKGQKLTVSGLVSDRSGAGLSGITVHVKGSKITTITGIDGRFSIAAEKDASLEFTGIGFEAQGVKLKGYAPLRIVLEKAVSELQEVAVVGYATKKRIQLSSAVSVVTGDKLNDVTSNELTNLLQGKAPGVVVSSGTGDPTNAANVLIRGAGTINASTDPLYVVDGNIGGTYNPGDIASVTVLRDAAATGLYGSRAANGVIIITTKSGKAGKTKIDFNTVLGFANASTNHFKMMNTQQLYDYQQTFFNPDPSALNNNTNWWDLAFRTAMVNRYSLSASGGTEKTQFYVSGNYYKEEGTLIQNDKTGYNFRTNLNTKLSEKLKLAVLLNSTYTEDVYNPASTIYDAYVNMPYDSAYNANGTPRDAREGTWFGRDRDNFLHSLQYNASKARSLNLTGDLNLDYSITPHLVLATYNRADFSQFYSDDYYDKRSKEGASSNGEAYASSSFSRRLLSSNRLRYSNNFGLHSLSALGVAEVEKGYSDEFSASVKGLPPGRTAFSTATDIINNPGGGNDSYIFSKYLGQVDYGYAGKYFAVASLVNEFSSRFGSNNPSANFFQLGASWILSNEKFMKDADPVSFLKLRASYGTTGNADGIGYYASLGLYSIDKDASYAGLPGAAPYQKANPNLTWEKAATSNLGVDIGFFKRIDLSVDIYDKKTSHLLFFKGLPVTSGYKGLFENVGSIRNRGLEFNLTTKNIQQKHFTWETNLNMAFNRNKVLEVNEGRTEVNSGAAQPVAVGKDMDEWYLRIWSGVDPANGDPLWENYIRDANGKEYLTYTNKYNLATRVYTGKSAAPKFTGGLTNSFTYQGFTLSAFFNFVYGNFGYNGSRGLFDSDGLYESYNQMVLAKGWSRWEKPGDKATHPKPVFGRNDFTNGSSTRYLEDASYIRLRNVSLGYNLPTALLSRIKISAVRFYVSGDNLWTGTNFSGTDPEMIIGGQEDGRSSLNYPISKKILFGLNISF